MVKSSKSKSEDKRKPKHGLDASRPSKGGKNQRDAATVRSLHTLQMHGLLDGEAYLRCVYRTACWCMNKVAGVFLPVHSHPNQQSSAM